MKFMPNEDIGKYESIIDLPAPVSERHARMPLRERAAQFSPFAALTGFDDEIRETARLTQSRGELSEEGKARIDRELRYLNLHMDEEPAADVTYFVCDKRKSGGSFVTETVTLKKIDTVRLALILTDGRRIPIDDLVSVRGINKPGFDG